MHGGPGGQDTSNFSKRYNNNNHNRNRKKTSRRDAKAVQKVVDKVTSDDTLAGAVDLCRLLDRTAFGKVRDSIATIDKLDGAEVQECWGLFKRVVAERTIFGAGGDMLPPSGFDRYRDRHQEALRGTCS